MYWANPEENHYGIKYDMENCMVLSTYEEIDTICQ